MTDTTDTMFDDILSSAAPAMPGEVAARLRSSVLAEVRIEARPIRQRWFARVAAVAVAATTILSGASYAVASAQPDSPLYPAKQAAIQVGAAVAGTVTQVLHLTPGSGSSGTGAGTGVGTGMPGSGASGGSGYPNSGIPTGTPMPGSGPGSRPAGGGPHGGSMSATGTTGPGGPGGTGGTGGGTMQPRTGTKSGPGSGGTGGSGSGSGTNMGPTAPSGTSGTSGGSSSGGMSGSGPTGGSSQPRSGGMTSPDGATHR